MDTQQIKDQVLSTLCEYKQKDHDGSVDRAFLSGALLTASFLTRGDGIPGINSGNVMTAIQLAGHELGFGEEPLKG